MRSCECEKPATFFLYCYDTVRGKYLCKKCLPGKKKELKGAGFEFVVRVVPPDEEVVKPKPVKQRVVSRKKK